MITIAGTYTEAQAQAIKKYREKQTRLDVRIEEGMKEQIIKAAKEQGVSSNQYVVDAIKKALGTI